MNPTQDQSKLGYYRVGEHSVVSKVQALELGTQLNIHPTWHFCDDIWNAQDWKTEPPESILELYKKRARQIREQYDTVVINYSGGSDSQTIVNAFLDANCHIDEIVTQWNSTIDANVNSASADPDSIENEFKYTTAPGINEIIKRSPQTRINYIDISEQAVAAYTNPEDYTWIYKSSEHLNPVYQTRWDPTVALDNRRILDTGRRVAFVSGIDKPRVTIKDNHYSLYFIDSLVNNGGMATPDNNYDNYDRVLFFWTPDMPEIVIKQAHMIRSWFKHNPGLEPMLHWGTTVYDNLRVYETLVRSIVYPEWDVNTFQCLKVTSPIWTEWDSYFWRNFGTSTQGVQWQAGIDYIVKNIDKKYLNFKNDRLNNFTGMINGFFQID